METLCTILLSWVLHLSPGEFEHVSSDRCPTIEMVPHALLEQQACEGRRCKVLGWYPGEGDVVYLDNRLCVTESDTCNPTNLFHTSIALHEVAHWAQGVEGRLLDGDCANSLQAERQAYFIQQQFLTTYGEYYPVGAVLPMIGCKKPTEDANL